MAGVSCSSCSASGAVSSGSLSVSGVSALAGCTCSSLTSSGGITGGSLNISGTSTQGVISCTSLTASSGLSGTIQTAAQPNISSLGTLTSSLNIISGTQYKIANTVVINQTGLGTYIKSSGLTSVGTLTGLTVSGAANLQSTTTVSGSLYAQDIEGASLILTPSLMGGVALTTINGSASLGGNCNLSSGSTYKINSSDVLTASTLGSSVTSSSLTSVGTLGNLSVGVGYTSPITYLLGSDNTVNSSIKKFGTGSLAYSTSSYLIVKGINSTDYSSLYSGGYTVEFWIYTSDLSLSSQCIFSAYDEGYFDFFLTQLAGTVTATWKLGTSASGNLASASGTTTMSLNS